MAIEIRTGNDVAGWVNWTVEIPEGVRWEILKQEIAQVLPALGGGITFEVDVTGLVELLEKKQCISNDAGTIRGVPYVHLKDLTIGITWWLHTGLDPATLREAGSAASDKPQAASDDTANGDGDGGADEGPFGRDGNS